MPDLILMRDEPPVYAKCGGCLSRLEVPTILGKALAIHSPRDVADPLTIEMAALIQEELRVVILNTKNYVMAVQTIYRGNVSSTLVRVGELYRDAIRLNAASVIIVHNHPSGDPTPSPDDLHLTAEALAAGRLLDITLLDHLVIASGGFMSLRDRGVIPATPR